MMDKSFFNNLKLLFQTKQRVRERMGPSKGLISIVMIGVLSLTAACGAGDKIGIEADKNSGKGVENEAINNNAIDYENIQGISDNAVAENLNAEAQNGYGNEYQDVGSEKEYSNGLNSLLEGERVKQPGPFGTISITIPDGWKYKVCDVGEAGLYMGGDYGIIFWPEDSGENGGHIELAYAQFFGVCGTGLYEENLTLAGDKAYAGYYDGSKIWDFVCFEGVNEGVVAEAYAMDKWCDERKDEAMEILDSMTFEPDKGEGAIGVDGKGSDNVEIGLVASIKHITGKSGTIVFDQYEDEDSDIGELSFGEDFALQKKNGDGAYETVPVVIDGEWGYNDIAYNIEKNNTTEYEYDWSWLYGELESGDYRVLIHVSQKKAEGEHENYELYAYFIVR